MKTCFCCLRRNVLPLNCSCVRTGTCRQCLHCERHCKCDARPAKLVRVTKPRPEITADDQAELDELTR